MNIPDILVKPMSHLASIFTIINSIGMPSAQSITDDGLNTLRLDRQEELTGSSKNVNAKAIKNIAHILSRFHNFYQGQAEEVTEEGSTSDKELKMMKEFYKQGVLKAAKPLSEHYDFYLQNPDINDVAAAIVARAYDFVWGTADVYHFAKKLVKAAKDNAAKGPAYFTDNKNAAAAFALIYLKSYVNRNAMKDTRDYILSNKSRFKKVVDAGESLVGVRKEAKAEIFKRWIEKTEGIGYYSELDVIGGEELSLFDVKMWLGDRSLALELMAMMEAFGMGKMITPESLSAVQPLSESEINHMLMGDQVYFIPDQSLIPK